MYTHDGYGVFQLLARSFNDKINTGRCKSIHLISLQLVKKNSLHIRLFSELYHAAVDKQFQGINTP